MNIDPKHIEGATKKIAQISPEDRKELFRSIEKVGEKYLYIQDFPASLSVSGDIDKQREFQRTFNFFYQVRRNSEWRNDFYAIFQRLREEDRTFDLEEILRELHAARKQWEYSFSTKMLHTLDPSKPIIDRKVLAFLDLPLRGVRNQETISEHYKGYREVIDGLMKRDAVREILADFDTALPWLKGISEIKKLDFLLWKFKPQAKGVQN